MKTLVPNYYHKFRCIADKCRHNCCIGWEIDIDKDTLDYYSNIPGGFGEKLRNNIETVSDCPHFILQKGDRCPFLERDGLCEIINTLGEDALCDICTDHPRFRNYYDNSVELGLGICCEEAARIILEFEEPMALICEDEEKPLFSPEEKEFLKKRSEILAILQNRDILFSKRILLLAQLYNINIELLDPSFLSEFFLNLERLDEKWTVMLENLKNNAIDLKKCYGYFDRRPLEFEQLSCYFVFRHFHGSFLDGSGKERIMLVLASDILIAALCKVFSSENDQYTDMTEICRMFSSEVEYSEENIENVLDFMSELN